MQHTLDTPPPACQPHLAAELLDEARRSPGTSAAKHLRLAEAMLALGRPSWAERCCRLALALQPDNAEAANLLGLTLLEQDRAEEALLAFAAALGIDPDYSAAHAYLAQAALQTGDGERARIHARRAAGLAPGSA